MAQPAYDHGGVEDNMPAERMLLMLDRSPQQSASLQAFLATLQDSTMPQYHHFLSPAQFAVQYGPSDADVQAVTTWLQGQGFYIDRVTAGRQAIEFSGTAGQVRQAFRTEIHKYVVGGVQHFANATTPDIPRALAPLVKGVLLGNFGAQPQSHLRGTALLDRASHRVAPLFNIPLQQNDCLSGYCFAVTPGDFAKIYNTAPLLGSGIDGTGITIGIVGDAPIDLPSAQAYRQNFLPAYSATNLPVPVLEGPAPSLYGSNEMLEAQLDVEVAGGVAPNATINFYYGASSYTSDGVTLGLLRAIDDNQASILSISFGGCESYFGDTYDALYNNLYQQAAAQGITVVAASGDSGSATCDPPPGTYGATQAIGGLAVSGMASTPYNIAVGGTDFFYPANATLTTLSAYWNAISSSSSNNNPDWSSAKGYIPEKVWNISDPALNQVDPYPQLEAGGGGKSSCVVSTGATPNVCVSGYSQPPWQAGFTQDSVRDVPDVSLFASNQGNYSFTPICLQNECVATDGPNSTSTPLAVAEFGGTSVSAPAFAGILALAEQKAGSRLGQANAVLYALAKQQPSAFHDITAGTNRVQCLSGTADCGSDGYLPGYSAGTGYDLATGLGSVDAAVLVNHWSDVTAQATTTTLSVSPATAVHGTTQTFTVSVTGGATSGSVALLTTAKGNGLQGQYATTCAAFPCTFTYAGMPGGSYDVAARFAGDATHAASISASVPVTITPENSEIEIYAELGVIYSNGIYTGVTSLNGQTLVYGGNLQFTAIPLPAGSVLPANPFLLPSPATGNVSVTDNGIAVGTPMTLNAQGNATLHLSTLPVGQHSLVVLYSGDAGYGPSTSSAPLATPMNFIIEKAPTSIALLPSGVAVLPGTSVTLTAHLYSSDSLSIDGDVAVQLTSSNGTVTLPATPLSYSALNGEQVATITIPASVLVAGTNTVRVSWAGNANLLASGIATATILVVPANTSMTLTATPAAPAAGQTVSATATLYWQTVAGGYGLNGTIFTSMDGKSLCGDSFSGFTNGSFDTRCDIKNVQPGTHTVTAQFPGDAINTPASASLTFTVPGTVPLSFGLTATPVTFPAKTANPSGTSKLSLDLAGPSSTAMTFSLSCSTASAPVGMSCNLPSTLTVAAGATQATASVTVSFAGTTAALDPRTASGQPLVWIALLPAAWLWRRKKWQSFAALCVLLVMMCGLSACGSGGTLSGGGGNLPPQGPLMPGTYAVKVTAQSGATISQAAILVRVQ